MEVRRTVVGLSLALLAGWSGIAPAQDRHRGDDGGGRDMGGRDMGGRDSRRGPGDDAQHDSSPRASSRFAPSPPGSNPNARQGPRRDRERAYPARGASVTVLPAGSVGVGYRGGRYFYRGGVWYRPHAGRYVVIYPPFGIVVPILPFYDSTMWVGGVPYYYANGVYYTAAPDRSAGYVVVAPPPGVELNDAVAAGPVGNPLQPIVYPRQGQSSEQTIQDRQECNIWANAQPDSASDPRIYERGMAACLEGRGYTVR